MIPIQQHRKIGPLSITIVLNKSAPAAENLHKEKKRKTTKAVKRSLHQLRKRGHLGPRDRMTPPPTKQKLNESMGFRRLTGSSTPLLTLAMRGHISFLKSAPDTNKFIST